MSEPSPERPRLGPYELSARLAKGGMAEIWVAANLGRRGRELERVCVVKRLLPQHAHNEEFVQMFLEEGRLAASFDHPNVVRTFDAGSEPEPFLAMEYLHGEDLRSVVRQLRKAGRTMPLAHAVAIVRRVAAGLHHAHEARGADGEPLGVIHRDVSPHNVLLTFDGRVKVVDFGIAKTRERRWETKHGTLKGKVPYMAPEQVKARRLDRRTDIYALGVVLYELVLGKRPYVLTASGDFAQMMAIARHDVVPAAEIDPTLDPALVRIIEQAMAYEPKERYATCERLVAELDAFAAARLGGVADDASLARFMEALFGARVDAWRAAISDDDALTHVIALEEARALLVASDDDEGDGVTEVADASESGSVSVASPEQAPAPASPAIGAIVTVGEVTVVALRGKIDETFDGAALGRSLRGTVLLDLDGVERITSFGVREWIEMTRAIADASPTVDAWLARCAEPIVSQMAHIRSFPGTARLLSFQAPFLCNGCGHAWTSTLDCERDAAWFSGAAAQDPVHAVVACPRCGGAGRLDDDPAFLSFAAPYAGQAVSPALRIALGAIEQADRGNLEWLEKVVSGRETRLRILRDVDPSVRWPRLLDGIEGRVVVEFRGAPRVPREAAAAFVRALRALGPEVIGIELVEAPRVVAEVLGDDPRVVISSLLVEGHCAGCGAIRTGLARPAELFGALRAGQAPVVACRRCAGPLALAQPAAAAPASAPPAASPPTPVSGVRPAGSAAASPWLAYAAFAAAFVIVLIAVAMKLHWKP